MANTMSAYQHHHLNVLLTVVGSTSAAATFVPGSEFRAWVLFGLSSACSIAYLLMNGKHVVSVIKESLSKNK